MPWWQWAWYVVVVVVVTEAKDVCSRRACKFISISAILNHRVDDLLVGVVCQIRLHRSTLATAAAAAAAAQRAADQSQTSRSWLQKLLHRRHKDAPRQCEDLLVLWHVLNQLSLAMSSVFCSYYNLHGLRCSVHIARTVCKSSQHTMYNTSLCPCTMGIVSHSCLEC